MCKQEGCHELMVVHSVPYGYCKEHANYNRNTEAGRAKREAEREMVERWKRDSHLREKMLPTVAEEQEDKCMGFWTCEEVEDGKPVNLCQWGERKVPKAAQQLDHIVTYAETQDDSRENLQMLCACCHAMKTAAERGAASIGRAAV